jgi:hypothetical protein
MANAQLSNNPQSTFQPFRPELSERYCPESRLVRIRLATNSRTLSAPQFHTHAVIFNVTDLIHELLKRRFR